MAGLKDRLTCPNCNKEIINKKRELISNCPYCGTWLPIARWSEREDVEKLSGLYQANEFIKKGITFQEKGDYEQAIQYYDQAIAIDATDIAVWNNKGACLSQLGKYEEAILCFDKTLSSEDNVDAWNMKGMSLAFLKRYDQALDCYHKAYTLDPANEKVKLLKSFIDSRAGSSQAVMNAGQEIPGVKKPAVQEQPTTVEGYVKVMKKGLELYNQGLEFAKQFKMAEAIKCYDEALSLVPEDESLWFMKAHALFFLRKYEEAIACYDKAIACGPTRGEPWYSKGLVLELLHREEEANECIKMAASLGHPDAKKRIKPKFSFFKR